MICAAATAGKSRSKASEESLMGRDYNLSLQSISVYPRTGELAQPTQVEDGDAAVAGTDEAAALEGLQRGIGARAACTHHPREIRLRHAHLDLAHAANVAAQRVAEEPSRDAFADRGDTVVAQDEQREPQTTRQQSADVAPQAWPLVEQRHERRS